MKIGYVLKYFPKLSETFVLNEMVALERAGAEVSVFAQRPSGGAPLPSVLGSLSAPVNYLSTASDAQLAARISTYSAEAQLAGAARLPEVLTKLGAVPKPLSYLRTSIELALHVHDQGIEHLHAHFAGPAAELARAAAMLSEIPFSFTCHAKDIYHESVSPQVFRTLANDAAVVVTVCEANRRYVLADLAPDLGSKLRVLYNGVDLTAFAPRPRAERKIPLVLGVGRLVAKKGFEYLIDAAAHLEGRGTSVDFVIVGDGRERAKLEARIQDLGVNSVRLIGAKRHDEVRVLLQAATALALPCVVDAEGNRDALPTVLLEALASSVPVVSTPVTGITEIIEHEVTGLLVPERDGTALSQALSTLIESPELRQRLGANGRRKAEHLFDLDCNARTLMTILEGSRLEEAVA